MINLKLAEYKEGKFEKFLKVGDFAFCGNFIIVPNHGSILDAIKCEDYIKKDECFFKDKKDPLNRFNGLFDGITYGNGRFVLIYGCFGQIWDTGEKHEDDYFLARDGILAYSHAQPIGNIFENPELYKKIR